MVLRFRSLFDREAAYVLGRLRWLGVPDRDRGDVAQEIFLDVARHIDRLDEGRPVRPWLATVTCNAARDYHRSARVRREQLQDLELDVAQEATVHDRYDAAATVRRLLAGLSYDDRELLVLVDLEERSVPEVAAILGANLKTIESRVARARERLAAALERLRATERRRLGAAGVLPAVLVDVDELLRVARSADEDLGAEVVELRTRLDRALRAPPAPRFGHVTPAGTWVGLALVTVVATVGLVDAIAEPPRALPDCTPSTSAASAAATTAPPPAPAVSTPPPPSSTSTEIAPTSSVRAPAPATSRTSSEASEAELIALARRAVNEGARARALALLRRHERAYPKGVFAAERTALMNRIASAR